ncbi:hypothetical protein QFC20_006805 [Naganishia adeliensis]|uniref:Uncharacterized protein n=1 Tax=Naganishia adeliensis TaxID=92952 RepID=A0ACC2V7B4_9TREE|nr:hypothetical protein QFC20_006805 [Naganishia adeliensis]
MAVEIALPSHVKTILLTGAGGFVGRELVRLLLDRFPDVSLIATDVGAPPDHGIADKNRLLCVAANLCDKSEVEKLFYGKRIQAVFALHGIMSGQSEADFELGYNVNIFSHLNVLSVLAKHAESRPSGEPLPVHVNVSSLAVYGGPKAQPTSCVIPEDTPLQPETSYGVCKSVVELITYDYSRKGFIDGRTVRLPTVCIRTGAPSSAASSFISGLVREPLQGIKTVCPIADSINDEAIEGMPIYVTRVKTVVENIARAINVKAEDIEQKVGKTRCINLPGIKITTRDILQAVEQAGGQKALDLIEFKKDPAVIAICKTWAGDYDGTGPMSLGFAVDDRQRGYAEAVADFQKTLKA